MNIFHNRPLFTACMSFICVSTVSYFLPISIKYVVIAVFAVVLIVSLFMTLLAKVGDKAKNVLLNSVLCSIAVILASVISMLYFNVSMDKIEPLMDKEHTVEATVISKNYESEFFSRYDISVIKIDGEDIAHDATLTCEYLAGAEVGDRIIVKATAERPSEGNNGVFNERLSMLSEGKLVSYTSYDDTGIIITESSDINVKLFFAKWNNSVSRIITDRVEGEAGSLSSAILLGNKNLLSNTTTRDFSRAGVAHILALSGMHMTIIMGAFTAILWLFTSNTKKIGLLASIAAVLYLALTGFSVSATRSVIMLLIVYLTMIIFNEPDPLTSLSIAGFVIVAVSPGSVLDGAFWMSFVATLGLLVFMPAAHEYLVDKLYNVFKGKSRRFIVKAIMFVLDLFMASIFALVPLIVVMCVFIKEMSWFGIISSAVLSLPATALILLSLLLVCLFYVPYLSGGIAFLIEEIGKFMIDYCAGVSKLEGVVFSLNYPFITVMAIVIGLALLYCFASNHKKKIVSLVPFMCSIALLVGTIGIYEAVNSDKLNVTYINASTVSDVLVLTGEHEAVICDVSNGSKTTYTKVLDEVYSARATEIRAIVLTGYSYTHASTFAELFSSEIVREIVLPYPENQDEYEKMQKIYDVAHRYGVSTYLYDDGEVLRAFDSTMIKVHQDRIERSAVPVTLINVNTSRDRLVYVSPAFNECDMHELVEGLFAKADHVVFGNKGPKVKSGFTIKNNSKIESIAFASEELIAYFDTSVIRGSAYFYVPEKMEFYLSE